MPIELRQHYVAFLDILGFSRMVESDISSDAQTNLGKLFRCHQSASNIFNDDPDCSITQFSDSIVVSKPYDAGSFNWFISKVAQYQRLLLDQQLICRGGISVNKHFSNGSFTFSAGLIDAYRVESKLARYPRVVVSPEVIELVFPESKRIPKGLVQEDDGLLFLDYIGLFRRNRPKTLLKSIEAVVKSLASDSDPSLREKGAWIASYSDAILGTKLVTQRFNGPSVK